MTSLEIQNIFENLDTSELFGCDCSGANIFLYQKYQNISFDIKNNVFLRYYGKSQDFQRIAFPLRFKDTSQDYLFFALENIIQDLNEKYFKIKECLARCGNIVLECNKEETKNILFSFFNLKKFLDN